VRHEWDSPTVSQQKSGQADPMLFYNFHELCYDDIGALSGIGSSNDAPACSGSSFTSARCQMNKQILMIPSKSQSM